MYSTLMRPWSIASNMATRLAFPSLAGSAFLERAKTLAFGAEIPFSVSAAKVTEQSSPEMGARARERAKWRSKFFIAVASIEDRREGFRSGLGKIRGIASDSIFGMQVLCHS